MKQKNLLFNSFLVNIENAAEKDIDTVIRNVFVVCVAVTSFFANIAILFSKDLDWKFFLSAFFLTVISIAFAYYGVKYKNTENMMLIIVLLVNLVFIPLQVVLSGDIYTVGPLLLMINIITCFALLRDPKRFFCVFAVVAEDFVIFRGVLYDPDVILADKSIFSVYNNYLLIFFAIAFLLIIVLLSQQHILSTRFQISNESVKIIGMTNIAKTQFLTNMSHEIRTPMNEIISLTEILIKEELDKEIQDDVKTIRSASYDLLSIIDDVLTFSKIDAGEMTFIDTEFSFDSVIKGINRAVATEINKNNLTLDITINPNIPKTILGDETVIRQIFLYLLFPSIERTHSGRILISIDAKLDEDEQNVTFFCNIGDNSSGLSQLDVDMLFGTYDVYDSRQSSNLRGMGLKFSICKQLLSMMDGDIEVNSIPGLGLNSYITFRCKVVDPNPTYAITTAVLPDVLVYVGEDFQREKWQVVMESLGVRAKYIQNYYAFDRALQDKRYDIIFIPAENYDSLANIITLYHCEDITYVCGDNTNVFGDFGKCRLLRKPITCIGVVNAINGDWDKTDYKRSENKESFKAPGANILVVDDNAVNLKVASSIFKKYGVEISMATNGEDALNKIDNNRYDLVLLDVVMPDLSGDKVLTVIRRKEEPYYQELPVIALTAQNGSNVRKEMLECGFQEFLVKPIKQRYLEKCLLDFLPSELIQKVEKEEKKDSAKEEAEKIPGGLVVEKGLLNIGFNKDAYAAILNTYYSEGMKYVDLLPKLLQTGDIRLFTTDVHGIKSSSASIGALEVSALFKELEFAGKADAIDEINSKFPSYMAKFKEMLSIVKQYLIDNDQFEGADKNSVDLSSQEEEQLEIELILELKTELDKMNLKYCDEKIAELASKNFGEELNELIASLNKAYSTFDFHNAKQSVNDIVSILEG